MARVTEEQMKKDEMKVIKQLSVNANDSLDKIAKKCGFSRQKVWRIIKNLEKNHIIWGYHAVTDNEKLHLNSYFLLIKGTMKSMKNAADTIIKKDIAKLADDMDIIVECSSYTNGKYDWIIIFFANDTKHAKKFCHMMARTFPDFIADMVLLDEMFAFRRCGFMNPDMQKFREFDVE